LTNGQPSHTGKKRGKFDYTNLPMRGIAAAGNEGGQKKSEHRGKGSFEYPATGSHTTSLNNTRPKNLRVTKRISTRIKQTPLQRYLKSFYCGLL